MCVVYCYKYQIRELRLFLVYQNPRLYYIYMKSKWYGLKDEAVALRKRGLSLRKIETQLSIPRSTLSGWFKNIKLSPQQQAKLQRDWKNNLVVARQKAVAWHQAQKKKRMVLAKNMAMVTLGQLDTKDPLTLELALAILYLGEGSKKTYGTSLGSSDPLILNFFISALRTVYNIDPLTIKAELHLRADQSPTELKRHWSQILQLPLKNFNYVSIDKRTLGSKTYSTYYGVCHLRCGDTSIQRRLIYLSRLFCTKVIAQHLGS